VKHKINPIILSNNNAVYIKMFALFLSLNHTRFWWGNPKERDHSEDQDVDKKKILNTLLNK